MSGSSFGNLFRVTTFGESHGEALGCVIDGCPAGVELDLEFIKNYISRRRPGQSFSASSRKETDEFEIVSGVFCGRTTGTPITFIVRNRDVDSSAYEDIKDIYRPGHADFTFEKKYGIRDYRGGGRSSGRETVARVCAGAIASLILREMGIKVTAYTESIAEICIWKKDFSEIDNNPLCMPDNEAYKKAESMLKRVQKSRDSVGGIIACEITGLPIGLGEPVFDKFEAELSHGIMSIGAIKGFEIGEGFKAAKNKGSMNNDEFGIVGDHVIKTSNHSGGVLGGITDGDTVFFRAAVKPTPSIGVEQNTVNKSGEECNVTVTGRHDTVIVPRAVVVVESMAAITVVDLLLKNMASTMDGIKKFYRNEEE